MLVNAMIPGVFRTDMNAKLLEGTERGRESLLRTPMGRYGRADELIGAAYSSPPPQAGSLPVNSLLSMAAFSLAV